MSIFLQTNGDQAKAWVKLMQEADDGDGTLTYEAKNNLISEQDDDS